MSCVRGLPTIMHHQMRTLARVGSMQRCRKCYRPGMRPPNSLQLALYSDLARDTPTHFQHFTVAGDLPLLPTQVCVTNNTVTVNDEKRWTLPQGEQFARDLVSVIHIVVSVHQAGKRRVVVLIHVVGSWLACHRSFMAWYGLHKCNSGMKK